MKLTPILNRQHIGFMFKKHWKFQGNRTPIDTGAEDYLKSKGIPVVDALEFIKEKPLEERFEYDGCFYETPLQLDKNHPDFKETPCYTLKNNCVLLEGLLQAQVLTKTVIAENRLPDEIEKLAELPAPKAIHDLVKKAILYANVFDCEQKKLSKKKDKDRPAYNFPRILGITDRRKNTILASKLIQLIEKTSDLEVTQSKNVINEVESRALFEKENELIQFQEISDLLITSNSPVKYDLKNDTPFVAIPDLFPVKHTVTLSPEHFYTENSKYPVNSTMQVKHPHTTWLHFNRTEISNIFETPVTDTQIYGRSLTHAFAVAAAYAKQLYGEEVKDLPEPVYINCIQADAEKFHFGVLELNTLNVDGKDGVKNTWYCKNNMKLYESSRYWNGMPVLEKYNPKVYAYISAIYNC